MYDANPREMDSLLATRVDNYVRICVKHGNTCGSCLLVGRLRSPYRVKTRTTYHTSYSVST